LHSRPELISALREILQGRPVGDELRVFRLQAVGLVRETGRQVVPRCRLYAAYFEEHLNG